MNRPHPSQLMEWEERFSVGNDEIDSQHKTMIRMLNHLNRAMKSGSGSDISSDLIRDLAEYALKHFHTEELIMLRVEYPGYEEHKAEHEGFSQQVVKFHHDLLRRNVLLSVEMLFFLRDWVAHHILEVDAKYKPYISQDEPHAPAGQPDGAGITSPDPS
jgi:hemerythrin